MHAGQTSGQSSSPHLTSIVHLQADNPNAYTAAYRFIEWKK
jgi:hypothetical protein